MNTRTHRCVIGTHTTPTSITNIAIDWSAEQVLCACKTFIAASTVLITFAAAPASKAAGPTLSMDAAIELKDVSGRIDHLAVDVNQHRLFVAELGNNSVDVLDLSSGHVVQRLTGLHSPQGIAFSETDHTLFVTSGGDGFLHSYSGTPLRTARSIKIGADADNIRLDPSGDRIYVGSDSGLSILTTSDLKLLGNVKLKAHPESFQLEAAGARIFVNVPEANEIAVVDRESLQQIDSWPTGDLHYNFALALVASQRAVLAAFRRSSKLAIFDMASGKMLQALDLCSDTDDLHVDTQRSRLYASCGSGSIDVFVAANNGIAKRDRVNTRLGARTSLYVPQWSKLYVAAPATATAPAEILVYRTND
jgi:DNA-binding beta-propeller fold protein YncE